MGRIIDLVDEVVRVLNVANFTPTVVATREYRPTYILENFKGLKVSVVPRGVEMDMADRTRGSFDIEIDIGVQKKVSKSAERVDIDPLIDLVEDIIDVMRQTGKFLDAAWLGVENSPIFDPAHLGESGLFTSIITNAFRIIEV